MAEESCLAPCRSPSIPELMRPNNRCQFHIAIICALPLEAEAVDALFDKKYEGYGKQTGDTNTYTTGRIAGCMVVLAHMPGMGISSAASVATSLRHSFTGIQLVLVVGICGGVPFYCRDGNNYEIVLGDVIISDAVVQYDFGAKFPDGFRVKQAPRESFGRPNQAVRALLAKLQISSNLAQLSKKTCLYLEAVQESIGPRFQYPGPEKDQLYETSYRHKHRDQAPDVNYDTCGVCDSKLGLVCDRSRQLSCEELGCKGKTIRRERLAGDDHKPHIHIGAIASGNTVMKSGEDRQEIAKKMNVIAFEMEGAGVWDNLPCVVIKGVCDYADSHKHKKFQRYAAVTAAACTKAFLEEWDPRSKVSNHSGCWPVSLQRNLKFVGRSKLLEALEVALFSEGDFQKLAIFGLGGIGKTQVAIELAYRTRQMFPYCSVFWVPSANRGEFERAYSDIAKSLSIPRVISGERQGNIKELVKQRLSESSAGQWLMIFDNADDMDTWFGKTNAYSLNEYTPTSSKGAALLTTRNEQIAIKFAGKNIFKVVEMDMNTSKQMLQRLLVEEKAIDDCVNTERLLDKLAFIPLAITQAAAFLNQYHHTNGIAEYLDLLSKTDEDLIENLTRDFQNYSRCDNQSNQSSSVVNTWLESFRTIRRCNPSAAECLSLISCVDPNNIPRSILSRNHEDEDDEVRMAISTLASYSFVTLRRDKTIDAHRLIHIAARKWLELDNSYDKWNQIALQRLAAVFLSSKPENREQWRVFMPHIYHTFRRCKNYSSVEKTFLWRYGVCLLQEGKHGEAERPLSEVVEAEKTEFGPEHQHTLTTMGNLAEVYGHQGRWGEAEGLFMHVKEASSRKLGEKHPFTLKSMSNLASAYINQGRWKEAEGLLIHVVTIRRRTLGGKDPSTLKSMSKLALVYRNGKKWKESEKLFAKIMKTFENRLGLDHPETLTSAADLAMVYRGQGRLDDAAELLVKVMGKQRAVLGEEHPSTLNSLHNLAVTRKEEGKRGDAVRLMEKCSELRKRVLGGDHPSTLSSEKVLKEWKRESPASGLGVCSSKG